METRLIIAYTLIVLIGLAALVGGLIVARTRRIQRRKMQGHRA